MRRIALLLLATACASASDPAELTPDEPDVAMSRPSPIVPVLDDDPCVDADGYVAELCIAASYDEDCVGYSCARTQSRTALECMLEDGVDTATFVALSRATNPVTRVYAREALLRRDAMSTAAIVEGLTDPAVVNLEHGCFIDAVSAAEPGFVALLQRDGESADALLRAFIESSLGRKMLIHGYGSTRARVLRATLGLADQPQRNEALRASVRALAIEAEGALPSQWEPETRAGHVAPESPAEALAVWTRAYGCVSAPARVEQRARAEEAKERERLLRIERELIDRARAE